MRRRMMLVSIVLRRTQLSTPVRAISRNETVIVKSGRIVIVRTGARLNSGYRLSPLKLLPAKRLLPSVLKRELSSVMLGIGGRANVPIVRKRIRRVDRRRRGDRAASKQRRVDAKIRIDKLIHLVLKLRDRDVVRTETKLRARIEIISRIETSRSYS